MQMENLDSDNGFPALWAGWASLGDGRKGSVPEVKVGINAAASDQQICKAALGVYQWHLDKLDVKPRTNCRQVPKYRNVTRTRRQTKPSTRRLLQHTGRLGRLTRC